MSPRRELKSDTRDQPYYGFQIESDRQTDLDLHL